MQKKIRMLRMSNNDKRRNGRYASQEYRTREKREMIRKSRAVRSHSAKSVLYERQRIYYLPCKKLYDSVELPIGDDTGMPGESTTEGDE